MKFPIGDRIASILLAIFLSLYFLNILVRKGATTLGWNTFYFGNIGEFLILFSAAIVFVVIILRKESISKSTQELS